MLPFLCAVAIGLIAASRLKAPGICGLAGLIPAIDASSALVGGESLSGALLMVVIVVCGYNLGLLIALVIGAVASRASGPAPIH